MLFQANDEPCVGTCNDMDEDIGNEEEAPNEEMEETESDSNIIVIDDDAQSEHFGANSDKPEATDTIYIDDTPEDNSVQVPDIDIHSIKFSP